MNPALLNQQTSDAVDYASRAEAVAAFHAGGSREWLAQTLARDYERQLGRDSVFDAVDHAIERALTELSANDAGRYPARALYRFAATAAWHRLRDELQHNTRAAAPVYGATPDIVERIIDRHAATPEELWLEGEHAHQVREAAAGLDELTLQVLWLRHVEGLKKPQIETQLGLTAKRVRTLLHAGNEKLYALFQGVESGTTCGGRQAGVIRLAFDLAAGQEARRAKAHVGHCLDCARRYERAQAYRRAVAGLIPFPLVGHAAPAAGLLDQLRLFAGRFFGRGGEDTTHAVLAARGGTGAATAAGLKLLGVCAAGVAVTGGIYCALNGLPAHHHHRPHQVAPKVADIAAAPPAAAAAAVASPTAEHARLVRTAAHGAVLEQRKAERVRVRRAKAAHKRAAARKASQADEFFSPYATPSGSSAPATSTTAAPTQPAPTQTTTSSQPNEFPLP